MKYHDNSTRKIFNRIHLAQNKNKFSVDKIKFSLNEKVLNLKKGFFKGKICADLGCGSTGSGGFNLLNLGAKYCHLLDMHQHIKKFISKKTNKKVKVLYGGSVNLENINNILNIINVDGVLVGGSSLNVKDFLAIYSAAVKHLDEF